MKKYDYTEIINYLILKKDFEALERNYKMFCSEFPKKSNYKCPTFEEYIDFIKFYNQNSDLLDEIS